MRNEGDRAAACPIAAFLFSRFVLAFRSIIDLTPVSAPPPDSIMPMNPRRAELARRAPGTPGATTSTFGAAASAPAGNQGFGRTPLCVEQCRDAVDKSLHAGGAFSATIPLVTLYHGAFMDIDVVDPTRRGQDLFVLSKGHAVAALAAIYAELGNLDASVLRNSRSYRNILNGHPGPLLPGVHLATGPMDRGSASRRAWRSPDARRRASTCLPDRRRRNAGGPDLGSRDVCRPETPRQPLRDGRPQQRPARHRQPPGLSNAGARARLYAFDWQVHSVDATQYHGLYTALEQFRYGPRNGKPTAIICHTTKGHGALSDFLNKHKVTVPDAIIEQELALQAAEARRTCSEFPRFHRSLTIAPTVTRFRMSCSTPRSR